MHLEVTTLSEKHQVGKDTRARKHAWELRRRAGALAAERNPRMGRMRADVRGPTSSQKRGRGGRRGIQIGREAYL